MRYLPFVVILLVFTGRLVAQSPHGKSIGELDCSSCHESAAWKVEINKIKFNHDMTSFKLVGQHKLVNCRSCHKNLVFSNVKKDCFTCHTDIHQNTVGFNCERCHTPETWIVKDIKLVHQQGRFPLVGVHLSINCAQCHKGYNNLNFQPLGASCYSCHSADYNNAKNPNHIVSGFSIDCESCHSINGKLWTAQNFQHDFFPLTGGHKLDNCFACHKQGSFAGLSKVCVSCHLANYNNTINPSHVVLGFGTDCQICHSITAWHPANFNHDQAFFPIYSGSHNGRWNTCADCHTVSTNYVVFSCMTGACHQQASTDNQHSGVQGYIYASAQCYACHPRGSGGGFNHATSIFPLTGAHITVDCKQCHQNGYPNTPTTCVSCHQTNYDAAANPGHKSLSLSTDCSICHTTLAGWKPAAFPAHNNYFVLVGAHSTAATCINCHNGNYINTPNQCADCHIASYNSAQNPQHLPAGISTLCQTCHTSIAWIPSTFNHAAVGFALTGQHITIQCSSCHVGSTSGLNTLCISCHSANYKIAPGHVSLGYPTTCEICHNTTDWSQSIFNHQTTPFPLTGAHTTVSCSNCHQNGFTGTPTICFSCHQANYNNTTNPGHLSLQLTTTCETCHSTNPGWKPAAFPVHNNYYVLAGAHTSLTCIQCHNGNYYPTSVPTDCYSCHTTDYNNTTNPNHPSAQFPLDCQTCHSQAAWSPSTFNHDQLYFPIYSGSHLNRWTLCSQCHQVPTNFASYTCMSSGCHSQASTDSQHGGVTGYVYLASACYNCHPRGVSGKSIMHPIRIQLK